MEKFTALYGFKQERMQGEDLLSVHKVSIWSEAYGNALISAEASRPKDMYFLGITRIEAADAVDNVMKVDREGKQESVMNAPSEVLFYGGVAGGGMRFETPVATGSSCFLQGEELEQTQNALIEDLHQIFGECAYEPSERGAGISFYDCIYEDAKELFDAHKVHFEA
jgi:hypothetical protein